MYVIEWIGGEVERYHTLENWQNRAADLKASGFRENWDFYCYKY